MDAFRSLRAFAATALVALSPLAARAQEEAQPGPDEATSSEVPRMKDLEVEAPRSPSRLLETPLSISVVSSEEISRAKPDASIDQALTLVPGVFSQGGTNFAQDARVAIRGFGSNAQFGIRGVRIYVDGVPSTLPDGQSEVDSLELDFVDRMEVLRGPISSLYGGGGGGTIDVSTFAPTPDPTARARVFRGSYGLARYSALTTGTVAGTGYVFGLSDTRSRGYRDHSRVEQWNVLTKLEREVGEGTTLGLNFSNVSAPTGEEPGGLTAGEVSADPQQAQPAAITFNAREKLDQQKLAFTARHAFDEGRELRAVVWGLRRDFTNALALDRRVNFDRKAFGSSLVFSDRSWIVDFTGGLDADFQRDKRWNFGNDGGARGELTLYQRENVTAVGPWAQAELELDNGLGFVAGVRWDWTRFDFGDRYVTPGAADPSPDSSDEKTFRDLSPRVGAYWRHSDAFFAYTNLGSAFQVPTTTELSTAGEGGLNDSIDAEKSLGIELGAKGLLGNRVFYDVAVFALRVRHVAVPFENAGGITIFQDAGETHRRGFELALAALLAPGLSARGSYTYASYRYHDFDSIAGEADGNLEPNAPVNVAGLELRYESPIGFFAVGSLRYVSKLWVNDLNTVTSPGATTGELRVGYDVKVGRTTVTPFLGVTNFTRVRYDDRIRPNAVNPPGRYFEPAPRGTWFGGVDVRFGD
jgi:iron complex outermembrane receptor protein